MYVYIYVLRFVLSVHDGNVPIRNLGTTHVIYTLLGL